jgi:hypothetical protein
MPRAASNASSLVKNAKDIPAIAPPASITPGFQSRLPMSNLIPAIVALSHLFLSDRIWELL